MYGFKPLAVIFALILVLQSTNGSELALDSPDDVDQMYRIVEKERSNIVQRRNQYNVLRHGLAERKSRFQQVVDPKELIRLNVGGQIIVTRRETLTKVPNSILAKSFDGSYAAVLQRDYDGSYFLDYNPALFSHLLDQLRVLKNNQSIVFRPPLSPSSKPFNQMLQDFGLPSPAKSNNDVIALNIGGEKIVTLRKTLTGIPASKLSLLASSNSTEVNRDRIGRPFLDSDPILFRHLLNQLRAGKKINDSSLTAPAKESQNAFDNMVKNLGVPVKQRKTRHKKSKKKSKNARTDQ